MKYSLVLLLLLFQLLSVAQKPKPGTYIFNYCDLEYNMCLGPCKVVIKNDSIFIYATKELSAKITFTKEGDVIDKGLILKHKSGKWIVAHSRKDADTDEIVYDGPAIIDLVKKQFWRY
ncbi:MAG TPA: hypothetical protein VF476_18810 [Chitinophagaceae bacterium]